MMFNLIISVTSYVKYFGNAFEKVVKTSAMISPYT